MKPLRKILLGLLVSALIATSLPAQVAERAALAGRITSAEEPLAAVSIYAYQLADLSIVESITTADGGFEFPDLPAGLFRIIALKPGFSPAVVGLTRASEGASQFLELELTESSEPTLQGSDFWAIRQSMPNDVLRVLEVAEMKQARQSPSPGTSVPIAHNGRFNAQMSAMTGIDERFSTTPSQLRGGAVNLRGEVNDLSMQLTGDFWQLEPATAQESLSATGQASRVSLELSNHGRSRVYMTSRNNELMDLSHGSSAEVGFENYRIGWSQQIGAKAQSDFSATYTEENNFYRRGPLAGDDTPDASRAWNVEGSYSSSLGRRNNLKTGFRYSESQLGLSPVQSFDGVRTDLPLPQQSVELYGLGGYQANRTVLLEYGLYSTLRDGSLTLAPRGGVVIQMGDHWQAAASATHSLRTEDPRILRTFAPSYQYQFDSCDLAEEYCYEFSLSREQNDNGLSIGTVHRKFDEPLRLFFDDDFFSHLESLYMVEGDRLPQVQLAASHRITPQVVTRLESNLGSGGGGIIYADSSSFQNDVAYMVTSLDTQFQRTSTGLFVAFHRLEQELRPLEELALDQVVPQIEIERLQLMLTQNLDLLFDVAANWAVHLNMELSRGSAAGLLGKAATGFDANEELRRRFTGGIAVRF